MRKLMKEGFIGAVLGLVVLGLGGRLVMYLIAASAGGPPVITLGGTLMVVGAGALSGAGGALLHALARAIANRIAPHQSLVRIVLFFALLGLVTMRGLRGPPPEQARWFWPLVVMYGVLYLMQLNRHVRWIRSLGPATGHVVLFEWPMTGATLSSTPALTIRGARDSIEQFIPLSDFGPLFGGYALWRPSEHPTPDLPGEALGVWSRRTCGRFRRILRERGATVEVRKEQGPVQQISQLSTQGGRLTHRDRRKLFSADRT